MSNNRGHSAHWLIVLNNEPHSPFWLVREVRGWQLADPSIVYNTVSLEWICQMTAGVAGVNLVFSSTYMQFMWGINACLLSYSALFPPTLAFFVAEILTVSYNIVYIIIYLIYSYSWLLWVLGSLHCLHKEFHAHVLEAFVAKFVAFCFNMCNLTLYQSPKTREWFH